MPEIETFTPPTHWKNAVPEGARIFPIRIQWNPETEKNEKIPTGVKSWKDEASTDWNAFDWRGADGFGIVTGEKAGIYTLDLDGYKDGIEPIVEWMREHGLLIHTRVHRTVSGGLHYLYRLPPNMSLPNRANIVPGLDARGDGGWIAFGTGYSVLDDSPIAALPIGALPLLEKQQTERSVAQDAEFHLLPEGEDMDALRARVAELREFDWSFDVAMADQVSDRSNALWRVASVCLNRGLSKAQYTTCVWHMSGAARAHCEEQSSGAVRALRRAWEAAEGERDAMFALMPPPEQTAPIPAPLVPVEPTFPIFTVDQLAGKPIPQRDWLVKGVFPANQVNMVNGDGAVGKSLLVAQLCVSTALGRPWLGLPVTKVGPAVFLTAEDDTSEVHRRMHDIANHHGVSLSALTNLHVVSLAGHDAVLATADTSNVMQSTALFQRLAQYVRTVRPAVVVLDTLADLFAGDENNRSHARQFVGILRGLAIEVGTTIILLAHPSKSAMADGTGYSGSTAWNGSVRGRISLSREKDEMDPDIRLLDLGLKPNYAQGGQQMRIKWAKGVFIPMQASEQGIAANGMAQTLALELLDKFTAQGRRVGIKTGPMSAAKAFHDHPDGKHVSKKVFQEALEYLLGIGVLELAEVKNEHRKLVQIIRRTVN